MRIDLGNANGITGPRPKRDIASTQSSKGSEKQEGVRDTLFVSPAAQQVDDLREKIKFLPSVRSSEVDALRRQLDAGSYRPDSNSVAEGILREHTRRSSI
jgi:negative regulator of flagellin synthesis FlgM